MSSPRYTLRKMGLEALKGEKGEFTHRCIPVFIELKRFQSREMNIEKYIIDEFNICGFPVPDKFTASQKTKLQKN